MTVLVTGAAGFIGFHVAKRLLADGKTVVGVDNFSPYYDTALKEARWAQLEQERSFTGQRLDISGRDETKKMFEAHQATHVIHLAAQAGVRHGLDHPHDYGGANLIGMLNVLEGCRHTNVEHLVYASTSSVYGANKAMPFSEHHGTAHPLSLYAATKLANEAMAHAYAHLFAIPATGLRFFTVYGPWGRPDMAPTLFAKAMVSGDPIAVFNDGNLARDFTYIDDIVEGVVRIADHPPATDDTWNAEQPDPATSGVAPHRLFNIGRGEPVPLMEFVSALENALDCKAEIDFQPMQPGDVEETWCDVSELEKAVGYRPQVSLQDGIETFAIWYREYYGT